MRRQSIKESMHSSAARIVDCLGLPVCVVQCPVGKVTGLSCDFKILSSVLTGQEKKRKYFLALVKFASVEDPVYRALLI